MNRTKYVQDLLYKVKENADQLRANNYQLYTGNLNAISGYTKEGIIVTNLSAVNLTLSKHHLIYKLTNIINGAFYIGKNASSIFAPIWRKRCVAALRPCIFRAQLRLRTFLFKETNY